MSLSSHSPSGASGLVELFHHRWTVPLLAELRRCGGSGRFVVLARRLGAAQESLRRTLGAALEADLIVRNPGHGHPLRPDYLLTWRGEQLAVACAELMDVLAGLDLEGPGLRKWSMPVVHALDARACRFAELRAVLALVTPRALSLALGTLGEQGLVEHDEARYSLAPRATPLVPPLRLLATGATR